MCPGHIGHVQLRSVFYNPLLFSHLVKLISRSCQICSRMKMSNSMKELFKARLRLLHQNKLLDERKVVRLHPQLAEQEFAELVDKLLAAPTQCKPSQLVKEGLDSCIGEMLRPVTKCSHCGQPGRKLIYVNGVKILRRREGEAQPEGAHAVEADTEESHSEY